jgi:6-pyruvoyltetrahydropterin/6-carboxytetrahydropterin synthase
MATWQPHLRGFLCGRPSGISWFSLPLWFCGAETCYSTCRRENGTMLYLTRKAEFAASHYYHNPDLSPEENRRIFGKCNNPNGHGHNYVLEVTVKGQIDPRSGFVVDLKQLKETMHREVLDAMDHRFLNKEVPEFLTRIPTTENMAVAIWQRLAPKLTNAKLHRVRVYENHDLFVDFYGEE